MSDGPKCLLRLIAGAMLALIAATLFLPLDLRSDTRLAGYLVDLLHLPSMALATCCTVSLLPARCGRWVWRVALAAGVVVLLVLAAEGFQPRWGRERDLADIAFGITGVAVATIGLIVWLDGGARARRVYVALVVIVVTMALVPAALFGFDRVRARNSFPLLAGFEDGLELGRWDTHAVRVARAPDHATEGRWSARVEVTDAGQPYPGFFLVEGPRDWAGMRALRADVCLPDGQGATLWVRVDDRTDQPPYGGRFQKVLALEPGIHRICISREEIARTSGGRALALDHVVRCGLFLDSAAAGDHFYIDNVRLEIEDP